MKIQKIKIAIFVLVIVSYSCTSDKNIYAEFFNTNYGTLKKASDYIDRELTKEKYKSNRVIIVFTHKPQYSPNGNYIYDKHLSNLMSKSHIKQIACLNNDSGSCGFFEEKVFQVNQEELSDRKVVYFIFSRCDENKGYQKKYLFQKKLIKNWVLLVDET